MAKKVTHRGLNPLRLFPDNICYLLARFTTLRTGNERINVAHLLGNMQSDINASSLHLLVGFENIGVKHFPCTGFGCISSYSYIKPQPVANADIAQSCCISSYSYIKPQRHPIICTFPFVVYHPIPTSNHNSNSGSRFIFELYIILFLHQTTT